MSILKLILRIVQLVFIAVVLGLSGVLVKGQVDGMAPSITVFALVCGIWGAIVGLTGIVSLYVESLAGLIMLGLDGLATLFFFAGSIAMAQQLGVGSCSGTLPKHRRYPNYYCLSHEIIAGGAVNDLDGEGTFSIDRPKDWFFTRCREAQADVAFLFFALTTFVATLVLSFMTWRRGGKSLTAY